MKTLTLNKNSWHYRLASTYPPCDHWAIARDICGYTRQVIRGMITCMFLTPILAYIVLCLILPPIAIFVPDFVLPTLVNPFTAGAIFYVVFALGYTAYLIATAYVKLSSKGGLQKAIHTGFIYNSYKSFKDKTCFKIDFKD